VGTRAPTVPLAKPIGYRPWPPVTRSPAIYDLMLLLDMGVEEDVRTKIVADARAAIEADGSLVGDQDWGVRPLAYPIDHRNQAEYHLLEFSGPPSLIASLQHTLRIADGVIRHRIIKLPAGATPVPAGTPAPAGAVGAPAPAAAVPPRGAPAAEPDTELVSA
jgi:small subunit ribosomal protein S6